MSPRFSYLVATLLFASSAVAADWPQWRGPNRDGVSTDTGLLKSWPTNGPKLLWEAKGAGRGYASMAITGGRVYTFGDTLSTADDTDEYVSCFDAADGKQIWKAKTSKFWSEQKNVQWQSPRSTPTVDGDRLYVVSPLGNLVCFATADGKEIWRKNLKTDFGGGKADGWGYSESPLIDGENLICTPGKEKNTMVALNKKTGEKVWSASVPSDKGAGHASVMPSDIGNTRVYVQTTGSNVLGVRASDGKVLWTSPIGATAVIPTPIIQGDLVFADAGYGKGGTLLRQIYDGDGVKIEKVYDYKKTMSNKHGGVILVGKYLFGDSEDGGMVWCADLMTGDPQKGWKERGSGSGSASLVAADGYLYIHYANGKMALAKATPEGYKETGSFKVPHPDERKSWSHPVVADGKLYVREGDWIMCYDVKQ
jgi:outer membrane protein assembly factor BamB